MFSFYACPSGIDDGDHQGGMRVDHERECFLRDCRCLNLIAATFGNRVTANCSKIRAKLRYCPNDSGYLLIMVSRPYL